jgi:hypothetical protein
VQERLRPWEIGPDVESEFVFEIAHGVNWLNAVPASRKAAFSRILCREMSSSEIALKNHKGKGFIAPHLRKNREEWATLCFVSQDYLRMPSFPMTVL